MTAAADIDIPRCPANTDAKWERECRRLTREAAALDAAGEREFARFAEREAASAYCRIQSPARQKVLGAELWGFQS